MSNKPAKKKRKEPISRGERASTKQKEYFALKEVLNMTPEIKILEKFTKQYDVSEVTARKYINKAYGYINKTILEPEVDVVRKLRVEQLKEMFNEQYHEDPRLAFDMFKELTKLEGSANAERIEIKTNYEIKFGDE